MLIKFEISCNIKKTSEIFFKKIALAQLVVKLKLKKYYEYLNDVFGHSIRLCSFNLECGY